MMRANDLNPPPKPERPDLLSLTTEELDAFLANVPEEYQDFADVFSDAEAAVLPPHRPYDHRIDLDEGTRPPHGPIYSMSETEQAFNTLKVAFCSAPILAHYDPSLPCILETDSSDYALGAVLSQVHPPDATIHPIGAQL